MIDEKTIRKKTMKLANTWWELWRALNSGQFATGSSDWRALDKDYCEFEDYAKEHDTFLYALRKLLSQAYDYDCHSEITALEHMIREVEKDV